MSAQGLELFQQQHGGMPNIIMVQSAFWELATLWKEDTQNGTREPQVMSSKSLPQHWLEQYMDDVSETFRQLEVLIKGSETLVAWRTTPYPRMHQAKHGWHEYEKLGQRSHLAELNAAARQVALAAGVPVIDLAAMMERFASPEEYTSDNHHVKAGPCNHIKRAASMHHLHQVTNHLSILCSGDRQAKAEMGPFCRPPSAKRRGKAMPLENGHSMVIAGLLGLEVSLPCCVLEYRLANKSEAIKAFVCRIGQAMQS